MRLLLRTCLIAILIVSLVETPVFASPSSALGVVLQAERARVGGGDAVDGATIFDGDTLATGPAGALRVRLGVAQLHLLADSSAALRQTPGMVSAALQRGTVVFSAAAARAIEVRASEARIRPQTAEPTLAQVTLVSPNEFLLTCQRGQLEVLIGNEVHSVSAPTSYRVLIDPEPQGPRGVGSPLGSRDRETCGEQRLYLKDGTYIVVSSYEGRGERVGYYSVQRAAWEEIPADRIDWEATRKAEKDRDKRCGAAPAVVAGRSRFIPITLILIGTGTGIGVWRALISPDKP